MVCESENSTKEGGRTEGIWEGKAHNLREDMTELLYHETVASMAVIRACDGAGVSVEGASGAMDRCGIGDDGGRAGRASDRGGSRLSVRGGNG